MFLLQAWNMSKLLHSLTYNVIKKRCKLVINFRLLDMCIGELFIKDKDYLC